MKHLTDAVICSIDFEGDNGVLIVGRQNRKGGIDIINAFQGEEAMDLYTKLTTKPERIS